MAACAPFVVWFASGIAMVCGGGMPQLTGSDRLQGRESIAIDRIRLSPHEAAIRAGVRDPVERVTILAVLGRPAYRFSGSQITTVFADTGEVLRAVDAATAVRIAAAFLHVPSERLRHIRTLDAPDQWTIGLSHALPLHHLGMDDRRGTEAYVSAALGEVTLVTDRVSRGVAWISAVPHWLYLTPLRVRTQLWRYVVLWASAVAAMAALAGLLVGVVQYRARYAGLKRWHYRAGALFGPIALTWVASGWLSMQPWNWAPQSALYPRIAGALSGRLDLQSFPPFDAGRWPRSVADAKEIDLVRIDGEPHYIARRPFAAPLVVDARTFVANRAPVAIDAIVARLTAAMPEVPIAASVELLDYDSYYYDRSRQAPLPVARIDLADPERTVAYVDLWTSAVVAHFTQRQRIERWAYHGFHSLDFPLLYTRRRLWYGVVVALCAGGLTLSVIGATMAIRRITRI
jgi:hypothetical protein